MAFRLNALLARLLAGSGIPAVLFVAVASVASVVIVSLIDALHRDRESREAIIEGLHARQVLDRMRLAAEPLPYRGRAELPAAYLRGRDEFARAADGLERRLGADPSQSDRVAAMRRLEEEWRGLMQQGLDLRR